MRRLENKVAVITGAAAGIGAATARRLASEGAKVVVADIDEAGARAVAKQVGNEAIALQFDAADVHSIEALVQAAVEHFGRIDILHNNVALTTLDTHRYDTTVIDIPFEIWDRVLNVNLKSFLAASKFVLPHMLAQGSGAIINMASGSGTQGDLARIAYGSSKGAIITMTRYIATQYGKQGIRCNSISPGLILTEASRTVVPELLDMIFEQVLTPRLGKPEDVAALVAFLASEDAAYINGQNIACNGGQDSHQPHVADLRKFLERNTK